MRANTGLAQPWLQKSFPRVHSLNVITVTCYLHVTERNVTQVASALAFSSVPQQFFYVRLALHFYLQQALPLKQVAATRLLRYPLSKALLRILNSHDLDTPQLHQVSDGSEHLIVC